MKIALITDQHFGVRNDSIHFHEYFSKFYENVFLPYLKDNNIETIVDLGDTFDRRKIINLHSLYLCKKYWFDKIENSNLFLHLIVGNHCTYFKNTNEINSPDLLLKNYKNIKVYSKPTEIEFDGCNIVLMPWMCQDNMQDALDIIKTTSAQVLLGHLELSGFEMYKGNIIDHGMDTNIFEKFDVVCSGHYHHKSSRGNINYLGCPYEITWSDYGDQKGFHVFDTETRDLTFIPNPYKMFNKINYDDINGDMSKVSDSVLEQYRETYIKIMVHNKANPYMFDQFIDRLEKLDLLGIQIIEDNIDLDIENDTDITEGAEDTLSILQKYVEHIESDVDKKEVVKFLGELYSEANNL